MSPTHRRLRVACIGVAAVLTALALTACGVSATGQVRLKVMQFATAVHRHDYKAICSGVLGPRLLADIVDGGLSCEKTMALALDQVHGTTLAIGTITVSGSHATAVTVTQATGQKTTLANLDLTKTSHGWRIESLGNAAAG